ncbi:MAG: DNA-binding domain-containing protein [Pirellulales bacterium]
MNQKLQGLATIQRWMQSVITHPDGVADGIESTDARREIDVAAAEVEEVVCRSRNLTAIERLEIYGNAYFARLLECLRESYPVLVHATGEEVFNQFAFGYLQSYPSSSYTLGRLADNFARYLADTRPDLEQHQAGIVDWPDLLIDLAQMEWAIEQVFDGLGVEGQPLLESETLLAIPPEQWPDARLTPVPCLRLLQFHYPVNDYFSAVRKDEDPPIPAPRPQFLALTRTEYVVQRRELDALEYQLLSLLVDGTTVGDAIMQVAEESAESVEQLAPQLQNWFSNWTAAGFFKTVEVA